MPLVGYENLVQGGGADDRISRSRYAFAVEQSSQGSQE